MCQLIAAGIIREWDGRTQQPGAVTRQESSKWAAKQGRRARRARTSTIGPVQSPKKLEWIANSMSATYPHAAPQATWRGRWARNTNLGQRAARNQQTGRPINLQHRVAPWLPDSNCSKVEYYGRNIT